MSESVIGSVCRNASSGAVCFCARNDANYRGKIVFKADEVVVRVMYTPFEWTCKKFGQRHFISWSVGRVDIPVRNELGFLTNAVTRRSHEGINPLLIIQAYAARMFGHLAFRVVGDTGCASAEDPVTSVTVSVERNGEKVSKVGPIAVTPRSKDLSVDVAIGEKDVRVTAEVVDKEK